MPDTLIILIKSLALILGALLPIVNPLGAMPIFLLATSGATESTRYFLAQRVAIFSAVLLLGAMFVGSYVLAYFGISTDTVRLAGGALVMSFGWKMLQSDDKVDDTGATPADWSRPVAAQRAFYPLTFPLTVGPGSIAVALTLGASLSQPASGVVRWLAPVGAIFGVFLTAGAIYICYRFADKMLQVLGKTGTAVMLRLMAFVLFCIGIEIFLGGVAELLQTWQRSGLMRK